MSSVIKVQERKDKAPGHGFAVEIKASKPEIDRAGQGGVQGLSLILILDGFLQGIFDAFIY